MLENLYKLRHFKTRKEFYDISPVHQPSFVIFNAIVTPRRKREREVPVPCYAVSLDNAIVALSSALTRAKHINDASSFPITGFFTVRTLNANFGTAAIPALSKVE